MTLAEEVREDRRAACRLPDKLTPSQWAERHRVLTRHETAEPGPWRNERTPYLAGIMDAVCEPGVEEISFVKPVQVGGSEAERNILGYWIDEDPGPCLIVMPTEQAVKEMLEERIKPLLMSSPSLRRHWSGDPHDITQRGVKLATMPIYFGWAGSPQSLATRPCRYVLFDECDKYPAFAGREADPISLGTERTATYGHRRKVLKVSTPTTREGPIWRSWEMSGDKRRFWVPCPHCGAFQALTFPQVRWEKPAGLAGAEKIKHADEVEQYKLAWYECIGCKEKILDHHKPKMLRAGEWRSEAKEKSKKVALHYNAIGSPWRSFSEVAGQWIRAEGDIGATMNVKNSWFAEVFESRLAATEPHMVEEKTKLAGKPNEVPAWAVGLFATADVQKDRIYYVIRAWGYGFRSALMRCGMVLDFSGLWEEIFLRPCLSNGAHAVPELLAIDDQYRRNDVVEFQKRDPRRIYRAHGMSHFNGPLVHFKVEEGLPVLNINTLLSKDRLDQMLNDGDKARWLPHAGIDNDYARQVTAEHKIWDPQAKMELWEKKAAGAANHYGDCEAIQCAVASHRHMDVPAPVEQPKAETDERSISVEAWRNKGKKW